MEVDNGRRLSTEPLKRHEDEQHADDDEPVGNLHGDVASCFPRAISRRLLHPGLQVRADDPCARMVQGGTR